MNGDKREEMKCDFVSSSEWRTTIKKKKLHILEFTESAFEAIDIVIKLVCKLKLYSHYYSDVICDMKMLS